MADQTKRPRPFSLAAGIGFITIGAASIFDTWTTIDASGGVALTLLFSGAAALVALGTRRAPAHSTEPE